MHIQCCRHSSYRHNNQTVASWKSLGLSQCHVLESVRGILCNHYHSEACDQDIKYKIDIKGLFYT